MEDNYLATIVEKEYQIVLQADQLYFFIIRWMLLTVVANKVDSGRPEISSMVLALATLFQRRSSKAVPNPAEGRTGFDKAVNDSENTAGGKRLEVASHIPEERGWYKG